MAVLGNSVATLVDVAKRLDPDGKAARIAEILNQQNEVLDDITWKEGNLPTGERTTVRAGLPGVAFRAINEGVPRSKSLVSQQDEGAAMLEAFSETDRKLAILSGDVSNYRLQESNAFLEAMAQTFVSTLFYGNASASPKTFTGLMTRYNSLTVNSVNDVQVIDCGGTGTDNFSIFAAVWDPQKITCIYPKNTKAGLFHESLSDEAPTGDGYPLGSTLYDANGNPYVGYRDHFEWNCGLSVKDRRFAVRAANISRALLTKDYATGADLQDILVQVAERLQNVNAGNAAIYMPATVRAFLRRQLVNKKNGFLSWDEIGGKRVMNFDGIPIRRVDAMNVQEARVV